MTNLPIVPLSARSHALTVPTTHANGYTTRPESPALDGRSTMPEEMTGQASWTDEDLVALVRQKRAERLRDGFRGGSGDGPADVTASTDQVR
jgi:hypothetical protein